MESASELLARQLKETEDKLRTTALATEQHEAAAAAGGEEVRVLEEMIEGLKHAKSVE